MDRNRNQHGQYVDGIEAQDALALFEDRGDQARPLTANDIKESLGWSRRTVHNKLGDLVEQGILETRKIGSRGRVWWVPISRSLVPSSLTDLSDTEIPTSVEGVLSIAGDSITGRSDEIKRERAEAVLTGYEFIQRQGRTQTSEIQEYVQERHPVEGTEKQSGAQRQWVNYLRDALRTLPGIEGAGVSRSRTWNFVHPYGELAETLDIEVDDWVSDIDMTAEGSVAHHQQAMIQLAYDYLMQNGSAGRNEFEDALPDYTGHYTGFEGFWSYCLRDALKNAPDVEYDNAGRRSVFNYTGG